jgi:tetratricopeptide (TPR) repeat protein
MRIYLIWRADDSAKRLARKLDGLPLGLVTAGAYLSQSTITFDEYLGYFEQSWASLHERMPVIMTYEDRTLYSTWQVSFEYIKQRNSVSANLLRLWAYFDNQDLWYELIRHIHDEDHQWMRDLTEDKLNFDRCMRVLCDHGLADANASNIYEVESTGYGVHACVHSWMRAVLNDDLNLELKAVALKCIASHVPEQSEPQWSLVQRRLLDHANRCVEGVLREPLNSPNLAWAYDTFGSLYMNQAKMEEAEEMYIRALRGKEEAWGPKHTSTLDTVNNLGILYKNQGKMKEAEEMYLRALNGYTEAEGDYDVDIAYLTERLAVLRTKADSLSTKSLITEEGRSYATAGTRKGGRLDFSGSYDDKNKKPPRPRTRDRLLGLLKNR